MEQYILDIAADCHKYNQAYWKEYYTYKALNDLVSIPLIVLSSGTVLVSQIASNSGKVMAFIVTGLGITSTVLSTLQRYQRYNERAIVCRNMAKSFDRIARKIVATVNANQTDDLQKVDLGQFIMHIQVEIDGLVNEIEDVPMGILMGRKRTFNDKPSEHSISSHSYVHLGPAPVRRRTHFSDDDNDVEELASNASDELVNMPQIPITRLVDIRSVSPPPPYTPRMFTGVPRARSFAFSPRTYCGDTLV